MSADEEAPCGQFDQTIGVYLDAVIVDANEHLSKIYYDKPFDPASQQFEPPACFSDNGIAPSRNAPKPQSPLCADCEWAVWGSKVSQVSGKGVKACHDQQKLALMLPGQSTLFVLAVPPNSLANLRTHVNKFKAANIPIQYVVTRIFFVSQGTLNFMSPGFIDAQQSTRLAAIDANATSALVGRTDQPRTEALPAPQQAMGVAALPNQVVMPSQNPAVVQAPFVQRAALPSTPTAPQQAMPAGAAPSVSPSEPARRRRRTKAEMEAAKAAEAGAQPATQAPAASQGFTPFEPAPAPAANGQFGIQQGAPPPADMEQTLDSIFGRQ